MALDFNEHIAILQNIQLVEDEITGALLDVGGELLANIKNRIAQDGKNSNNQQIGQYSTKPMYATEDMFDKKSAFKPSTKNSGEVLTFYIGTKKKKRVSVNQNFRQTKSMYLESGYKELRDIQGKPTQFVNLVYRSDMMASYQMLRDGDNAVVIGFRSETESIKRKALEKKYNQTIFSGSQQELAQASEGFTERFNELSIKFLKGDKG